MINKTPLDFSPLQEISGRFRESKPEGRVWLGWWYRISVPDEEDDLKQQAALPRSRLASLLLLIGLVGSLAFLPSALTSSKLHTLPAVLGLFLVFCLAIPLNKRGKVTLVGILFVIAFDAALIFSLLSFPGFMLSQNSLPIYDLFVLSDVIAISLLPSRFILYISFFHTVFICTDIFFQPHTPDLEQVLLRTSYSIMIRPLTIQIVVALIMYLWVRNAMKAIERANKAELIAELESTIVQQKRDLDEGIQTVLYTLVQAANGDASVRTPLARDHALWQVGATLNVLLARQQRTQQSEVELQRLRKELERLFYNIQDAKRRQRALNFKPGGTELDPIMGELLNCYLVEANGSGERKR